MSDVDDFALAMPETTRQSSATVGRGGGMVDPGTEAPGEVVARNVHTFSSVISAQLIPPAAQNALNSVRSDSRQEVEVGADSTGQQERAGRFPPAGRLSHSRSRSAGFSKNEARSPDFLLFSAFDAEHGASVGARWNYRVGCVEFGASLSLFRDR
jgi:hypothetical protein